MTGLVFFYRFAGPWRKATGPRILTSEEIAECLRRGQKSAQELHDALEHQRCPSPESMRLTLR